MQWIGTANKCTKQCGSSIKFVEWMKRHNDDKFQRGSHNRLSLSLGYKRIKRDEDSFVPIVCTSWQSNDFLGMLRHDLLGPGIGFYSSIFFPTVNFTIFFSSA